MKNTRKMGKQQLKHFTQFMNCSEIREKAKDTLWEIFIYIK